MPDKRIEDINLLIQSYKGHPNYSTNDISDGYHTFKELYDHRIQLYIKLVKLMGVYQGQEWINPTWKSKLHHDGTGYEGWFILGIYTEPGKQISYHLPMDKWNDCSFAKTLDKAPEWDGHSPNDVLNRLKQL